MLLQAPRNFTSIYHLTLTFKNTGLAINQNSTVSSNQIKFMAVLECVSCIPIYKHLANTSVQPTSKQVKVHGITLTSRTSSIGCRSCRSLVASTKQVEFIIHYWHSAR